MPQAFFSSHLGDFSAPANLRTLKIQSMEIHRFIPNLKLYFEHLSLTLRSITLHDPRCTLPQLSHFLSFFSNLDDIEIWPGAIHIPDPTVLGTELVSSPTPKLRGRLVLYDFSWVETWTHLSSGGPRFRHMDAMWTYNTPARPIGGVRETLENPRLNARGGSVSAGNSRTSN